MHVSGGGQAARRARPCGNGLRRPASGLALHTHCSPGRASTHISGRDSGVARRGCTHTWASAHVVRMFFGHSVAPTDLS